MWVLDYKESWTPKNWCFWAVVLKKTLESPFDCKEIQPVHPKGDQSWMFIGRTDAEAETPVLWPPHVKSWLIRKDPDAGRDWRWEEKGMTGWDGWIASPTHWTWVRVNSGSCWWTGRPGVLWLMGSQRVGHNWATELTDWCSISQYPVSITNKWLSSNLAGESHWSNTVSELNTLNYLCCFLTQPKEERKGKQSIILKTELERS